MTEVALRSYLHEIEKHIETGRTDQAIAHSRYILQAYPKYVDAYRLLGKSYLESQRYTDAGDIFQRVLSSVPDDFVSHVGMSIIREDEGNLDESIWHMERAFEVQPSNNAIQEELRRLHGKRDNVEPPKIRLTRGALARLYYKGELYQQAIGEIRAALGENPTRLDLQALLADIYYKTNQRVEAADTAVAILRRLPNCVTAIQVMIQVLAGADREMDLKSYQTRLAQLNPYAAFTSPTNPDFEAVTEQAVLIEKLDWKPDQSLTGAGQPAWAASLGVDLGDMSSNKDDVIPEWLERVAPELKAQESPAGSAPPEPESEEGTAVEETLADELMDGDVPEWLREAGWQPSAAQEPAPIVETSSDEDLRFEEVEEITESEDLIAEAEIPDWLQAMAPQAEKGGASGEEDLTPWLEQLLPSEQRPASQIPEELAPETSPPEAEKEELPDWLIAAGLAGAGAAVLSETPAEGEATPVEVEAGTPGQVMPESAAEAEIPDWLKQAAIAPEIMEQVEPASEEKSLDEAQEELPDWLFEAQQPTDTAEAALEGEPIEEPPLEPAAETATFAVLEETPGEKEEQPAADFAPEAEIPGWLLETEESISEEPALQSEGLEQAVDEEFELPDWLKETEPETAKAFADEESAVDIPSWLLGTHETGQTESSTDHEEPGELEAPGGEIPGWLMETETAWQESVVEEERASAAPAEEAAAASTLPDWLLEMQASTAAELPELEEQAAPEAGLVVEEVAGDTQPTRLERPGDEPIYEQEAGETSEEGITAQKDDMQEAFAWLLGLREGAALQEEMEAVAEAEQPGEAEISPTPVQIGEELVDITSFPEEETPEVELVIEQPSAEEQIQLEPTSEQELIDQDAAFAWLESLAVKQGASEALLLTPEERIDTMPEWVKQDALAAAAEPEIELEAAEAEPIAELPPDERFVEERFVEERISDERISDERIFDERIVDERIDDERIDDEPIFMEVFAEEVQVEAPVLEVEIIEEELVEFPAGIEALEEAGSAAGVQAGAEVQAGDEEPTSTADMFAEAAFEPAVEELVSEHEEAPEAPAAGIEAEVPELPDWLSESAVSPREELEWTPPAIPQRQIDLNQASLGELERIPGTGFITAQRISDFRDENGPFNTIDDLLKVPGIDAETVESMRDYLLVEITQEVEAPAVEEALHLPEADQLSGELHAARLNLSQGNLAQAVEQYSELIRTNQELKQVAIDLQEAAYRYPEEIDIWQSLGDAYLRLENVQEALQAYIKAEQLLG